MIDLCIEFILLLWQHVKKYHCNGFQENFEALQKLLEWSWTSFNAAVLETDGLKGDNLSAAVADIQRLVYITRACLRLIKTYVTQIYPNGGKPLSHIFQINALSYVLEAIPVKIIWEGVMQIYFWVGVSKYQNFYERSKVLKFFIYRQRV